MKILMDSAINATEVRKNWSSFLDEVIRKRPKIVKRNRDYVLAMSIEHLQDLVQECRFIAHLEQDSATGHWIATLQGFDLIAYSENKEDALLQIANELMEYAHEYINEFELWHNAPNRKQHFPYLVKVMLQDNAHQVRNLIQCPAGEN
ncbi:MAG: hypothetical protein FH749_02515 [Firmicutes bacterium]|nr:hypothetical protein [Bacillota bacterium]